MGKGFAIICFECGNEVTLSSKPDDYMGFAGWDIVSSNPSIIKFSQIGKATTITCECGNVIKDN